MYENLYIYLVFYDASSVISCNSLLNIKSTLNYKGVLTPNILSHPLFKEETIIKNFSLYINIIYSDNVYINIYEPHLDGGFDKNGIYSSMDTKINTYYSYSNKLILKEVIHNYRDFYEFNVGKNNIPDDYAEYFLLLEDKEEKISHEEYKKIYSSLTNNVNFKKIVINDCGYVYLNRESNEILELLKELKN